MDVVVSSVVGAILSYLIGSIPSAYIVGRMAKGVDIRKIGTGNMGAMNVFYKVGFWPGLVVGIAELIFARSEQVIWGP
ncbi:MAG: glycerol-3-phosphate acyltransferase [Chloroflexi bacterium]|nr:glycerol-3-phosphate acyltransferase [Chloroflexota bacterium]